MPIPLALSPDWLGSPQHLVAGAILGFMVGRMASRWVTQPWLIFVVAVGVVCTAELVVELIEYPLLYSGKPHVSAYYDTLADLADTIVGGVIGAALSLIRRHRVPGTE
jgi:cell shape-determining protein MreD